MFSYVGAEREWLVGIVIQWDELQYIRRIQILKPKIALWQVKYGSSIGGRKCFYCGKHFCTNAHEYMRKVNTLLYVDRIFDSKKMSCEEPRFQSHKVKNEHNISKR